MDPAYQQADRVEKSVEAQRPITVCLSPLVGTRSIFGVGIRHATKPVENMPDLVN